MLTDLSYLKYSHGLKKYQIPLQCSYKSKDAVSESHTIWYNVCLFSAYVNPSSAVHVTKILYIQNPVGQSPPSTGGGWAVEGMKLTDTPSSISVYTAWRSKE